MTLCYNCRNLDLKSTGCVLDPPGVKFFTCTKCDKYNPIIPQNISEKYMQVESHDPDHYKGSIEAIDAFQVALGKDGFSAYCRGQVMRYMWRLGKKDEAHKEAKKALVYAQWLYDNLTDMPLTKDIK